MTRKYGYLGIFTLIISMQLFSFCTPKDETGPGKIRWDSDVCEHCKMAVSDHYFSAQIRGAVEGKRTKLYFFDDLGCAVLWVEKQEWKDDPRTEMWVNDFNSGEWIDAKISAYDHHKDLITPMDFGLGATTETADSTYTYTQAVEHIYKIRDAKKLKMKQKHPSM